MHKSPPALSRLAIANTNPTAANPSAHRSAVGASKPTNVVTFSQPMLLLYACSATKGTIHQDTNSNPVPTADTVHHNLRHEGPAKRKTINAPTSANAAVRT